MGLFFAKLKHKHNSQDTDIPETVAIRYLESLLTLYGTITTNFTNGTGKKTFRAENLYYLELIEEQIYDCIEHIEEEHGEVAVFFYKVQLSSMESTFKKGLQFMRGEQRLRIEKSIQNHERIIGWIQI